jgi:predicted transposase/invertase (TIGR01784 family)
VTTWMRPSNDFVFKRIFGVEENKDILLSFLNAVLKPPEGKELTEITLVDPHIHPNKVGDKKSILDVKAQTAEGERINIEIQVEDKYNMNKRTLYYWAKMYEEQLESGQDYELLNKAITINILNYVHLPTDNYHSVFHLREDVEGYVLCDDMEFHFLELPKLRKATVDLNDRLVNWLLFVGAKSERMVEELAIKEPAIQKAKTVLDFLNQDEEARRLYELREQALKDEQHMLARAEKRGREEGKAETARNLLTLGVDVDTIAKATGLSQEEIEKLKQQLH